MFYWIVQTEYLSPQIRPFVASLLKPIDEIQQFPSIEYERALYAITKAIIEIIDAYDSRFLQNVNNESWYRKFWSDVPKKWDIFTFNYDNTVENSLQEFEDGFESSSDGEDYEHFNPSKLITNSRKLSTIHHLHGSTRYSEVNPRTYECVHSHRDMYKVQSAETAIKYIGVQSNTYNQANERYFNSPIIIGLRKLDKLTFLVTTQVPFSWPMMKNAAGLSTSCCNFFEFFLMPLSLHWSCYISAYCGLFGGHCRPSKNFGMTLRKKGCRSCQNVWKHPLIRWCTNH